MKCPNCGQEASNVARYCSRCGQQLRLVCQSCSSENTLGSLYCSVCGKSLTEQVAYESPGNAGSSVPTRSQVTNCPRCFANNEPGAVYCYRCGLPLEGGATSSAGTVPGARNIPVYSSGRPGGFWVRAIAFFIDQTILGIALGMVGAMLWGAAYADFDPFSGYDRADLIDDVVKAGYFTLAVALWATTVGKRVFGMFVVRPDGSRVGYGRALARYLAYILSGVLLGIGFIMIGVRQDKRGLHDLICDTVVVRR